MHVQYNCLVRQLVATGRIDQEKLNRILETPTQEKQNLVLPWHTRYVNNTNNTFIKPKYS